MIEYAVIICDMIILTSFFANVWTLHVPNMNIPKLWIKEENHCICVACVVLHSLVKHNTPLYYSTGNIQCCKRTCMQRYEKAMYHHRMGAQPSFESFGYHNTPFNVLGLPITTRAWRCRTPLANGSVIFKWKLSSYWLKRLRLRYTASIIQASDNRVLIFSHQGTWQEFGLRRPW